MHFSHGVFDQGDHYCAGVNKKPKKNEIVCHRFEDFLKLSIICSMVKTCSDRDNPPVPLLPDTLISVCQMRISLKLSVRFKF